MAIFYSALKIGMKTKFVKKFMIELRKCSQSVSHPLIQIFALKCKPERKKIGRFFFLPTRRDFSRNWFRFYSSSSKTRLLLQISELTWILFYVIPPPPVFWRRLNVWRGKWRRRITLKASVFRQLGAVFQWPMKKLILFIKNRLIVPTAVRTMVTSPAL